MNKFDLKTFLDELVKKTIPDLPEEFKSDNLIANQGDWLFKIAMAIPGDPVAMVVTDAVEDVLKFIADIKPIVEYTTEVYEKGETGFNIEEEKKYKQLCQDIRRAYDITMQFGDMLMVVIDKTRKAAGDL
ncbi:MAG: hypothetical protein P4L77_11785 [Sulfuriferula sp.]|nr:hypothetical protein [Sulfuriferula sp.]